MAGALWQPAVLLLCTAAAVAPVTSNDTLAEQELLRVRLAVFEVLQEIHELKDQAVIDQVHGVLNNYGGILQKLMTHRDDESPLVQDKTVVSDLQQLHLELQSLQQAIHPAQVCRYP